MQDWAGLYVGAQALAAVFAMSVFAFVSGLGPLNPRMSKNALGLSWPEAGESKKNDANMNGWTFLLKDLFGVNWSRFVILAFENRPKPSLGICSRVE